MAKKRKDFIVLKQKADEINDPNVWVSQVQGPLSMKLLENLSNGFSEKDWKYFDWKELQILDQLNGI